MKILLRKIRKDKFDDLKNSIIEDFESNGILSFPEELIDRIVTSTNAQVVLDPFGGSGTSAVSAKKAGRDFIYIDNSETYCEMARKRIDGEEWQK